jgi:hypothetical protein
MNNIERFTLELAKQLIKEGWHVNDDGHPGPPNDINDIQEFLKQVKSCAHILLNDDLETRIERARRELEFLEGLR